MRDAKLTMIGRRGTIMVPLWNQSIMAVTLTLKSIPDELYRRLKATAEMHHRSLNSEAIVCLESALFATRVAPAERLARARALRAELDPLRFPGHEIDADKRQGRP